MSFHHDLGSGSIVQVGDKAVAPPRYGDDESMVALALAENLSERRDVNFKISFFDELSGPYSSEEIVFAQDLTAKFDQCKKQIEGFWSEK